MSNSILSGKRVIVVEDEPPISTVLGIMLGELGCVQVGDAKNVREAMVLSQASDADVVLLDYRLHGEVSATVARGFLDRGIKVILTTGAAIGDLPQDLQCCAVVQKPFGLDSIERGLLDVFARAPVWPTTG